MGDVTEPETREERLTRGLLPQSLDEVSQVVSCTPFVSADGGDEKDRALSSLRVTTPLSRSLDADGETWRALMDEGITEIFDDIESRTGVKVVLEKISFGGRDGVCDIARNVLDGVQGRTCDPYRAVRAATLIARDCAQQHDGPSTFRMCHVPVYLVGGNIASGDEEWHGAVKCTKGAV